MACLCSRKGPASGHPMNTGEGLRLPLIITLIAFSKSHLSANAQGISQDAVVMDGPCSTSYQGPCNRSVAHFVLGGLFPIHQLRSGSLSCSEPGADASFFAEALQWTEAFRHAVDLVNANPTLLPDLTLGYAMRDTCSDERESLRQSLSFLGSDYCRVNGSELPPMTGDDIKPLVSRVAGVVGPYTSSESISVTDLFDLFEVPVVSYAATSSRLSDKARFPHFLRTTPSDNFTSQAVVQLARKLNWTFLNVINTNDDFGNAGAQAVSLKFRQSTDGNGRGASCVGTEADGARRSLSVQPTTQEVLNVWHLLLDSSPQNKSNGAVLFTQKNGARELFKVGTEDVRIRRSAKQRNLTFLGVGAWGDVNEAVSDGLDLAKGSVSVIASGKPVLSFDQHFGSLHPSTTKDNPWLIEGWEHIFNCSLRDPQCGKNNLTDPKYYTQSSKVPFVYDAVFAFAKAFHDIYINDCRKMRSNCASLTNATRALEALRNVSFTTVTGSTFQFDKRGDPVEARYTIKNIIVDEQTKTALFPEVGMYHVQATQSNQIQCEQSGRAFVDGTCFQEELTIDIDRVVWNSGTKTIPESKCSESCQPGSRRLVPNREISCCWTCIPCLGNKYSGSINADSCTDCSNNEEVVDRKTACRHVQVEEWSVSEPFAVGIIIIAGIGCVAVVVCILRVLIHRHNSFFPLGLEPTLLCLSGLLVVYIALFFQLGGSSVIACGIQTVCFSLGFSVAIAPLVVFSVYRCCVITSRPQAGFLHDTHHRAVVSLAFIVPGAIMVLFTMLTSPPNVSSTVTKHVKEERECSYGMTRYILTFYVDLLLLVCVIVGAYTLREERHQNFIYKVDARPRVLYFTAVGSLIALFINIFSIIMLETITAGPVAEGGIVHILVWLMASALLLLVFTQQMRKLGPLSITEKHWLASLQQCLLEQTSKAQIWQMTNGSLPRKCGSSCKEELSGEDTNQRGVMSKYRARQCSSTSCYKQQPKSDHESLTSPGVQNNGSPNDPMDIAPLNENDARVLSNLEPTVWESKHEGKEKCLCTSSPDVHNKVHMSPNLEPEVCTNDSQESNMQRSIRAHSADADLVGCLQLTDV